MSPAWRGWKGRGAPPDRWVRENTFLLGNVRIPLTEDEGNIAIIGGVGSGKTTLLEAHMESVFACIPDWLTSINGVVGDPKNDLLPYLSQMDLPLKVISAHVLDEGGWCWRICEDLDDCVAAEQFAYDLLPEERGGTENKFFNDAPRHIVAGVVRELVRMGRPWTLRHVYLLAMGGSYARRLFEQSPDPVVRDRLALLSEDQGTARANIHSSLLTKLGNVATYAALMDRCAGSFSVRQLVRGEQVLVLGNDFRFGHILGPMNNLLLNFIKRELIAQGDSRTRRHYVIVDEFPKLNQQLPAEEFPDFCELGRSRGVRVVIVMQSPLQLKKLYGEEGLEVLMGQCMHKVVLRLADHGGATFCSNLLGRIHGYEWTRNVSDNRTISHAPGGHTTSWGVTEGASETFADRPLIPPHALMELPRASRRRGFRGYAITPALPGTNSFGFTITPQWLREHLIDVDTSLRLDDDDRLKPFPSPRPRQDQVLRPLHPDEAARFGLAFDPNGARP